MRPEKEASANGQLLLVIGQPAKTAVPVDDSKSDRIAFYTSPRHEGSEWIVDRDDNTELLECTSCKRVTRSPIGNCTKKSFDSGEL